MASIISERFNRIVHRRFVNDPSPNVHSYPRCIISRSPWFTAPTWRVQAAALFLPGDNRVRSRFIYPCPMHLMGRRGDKEAGFVVQLNVRQKDTGPRSSVLTIISITLPFNLSINYFPRSRLRRFLRRSWFILWEREREIQRIPFTMQKGKGMAVLPSYDLFHLECCYTYMCIYTCAEGRNSDYSRNIRYWAEWLL